MPWVHRVPLWAPGRGRKDDVLAELRWLRAHPERAAAIGAAGREFACAHLTSPGRTCWWRTSAFAQPRIAPHSRAAESARAQ